MTLVKQAGSFSKSAKLWLSVTEVNDCTFIFDAV